MVREMHSKYICDILVGFRERCKRKKKAIYSLFKLKTALYSSLKKILNKELGKSGKVAVYLLVPV